MNDSLSGSETAKTMTLSLSSRSSLSSRDDGQVNRSLQCTMMTKASPEITKHESLSQCGSIREDFLVKRMFEQNLKNKAGASRKIFSALLLITLAIGEENIPSGFGKIGSDYKCH